MKKRSQKPWGGLNTLAFYCGGSMSEIGTEPNFGKERIADILEIV